MLRLSRCFAASVPPKGGAVRAGKAAAAMKRSSGSSSTAVKKPTAVAAAPTTSSATQRTAASQDEGAAREAHDHHDHRSAGKLHFDATKAGLQHVDKDYVEQVIQEASKGSAFYQKEQRLEEARRRKAEILKEKAKEFDSISPAEMRELKAKVDTLENELESTRDLRRRYIHVDMDMFFAAVEEKKTPALRGKPFGVGAMAMLSTTNYIARQYGVRSGMPGFIGKKLCPELILVPLDMPAYKSEAARVQSIAARYDAQFVSLGMDELTMDVTRYLEEFPTVSASDIANDFRDEVFLKTQLTSSGGIGPTSLLAKIASNVNKPNGQHEITLQTRDEVIHYMHDIPLRKIPGIGYAQELTLSALDIHTCGDLLKNKYLLAYLFREKTYTHYLSVGLGLAETFSSRKPHSTQSLSRETSLYEPLATPEALSKVFRGLLDSCHARCVREHLKPKSMRLVLKYRTFDVEQFSEQLPMHTSDLKLWLEAAQRLLQPHLLKYAELRLVGIRFSNFEETGAEAGTGPKAGSRPDLLSSEPSAVDDASHEEDADEDLDEDDSDNTHTASASKATDSKAKKAPIPVSRFLSKPGTKPKAVAAAPAPSVKSARKQVKSSSGSSKRKLRRKK